MNSKGHSETTTGIYFRHLRAIFNKAIQAEIIDQKCYPFGKTKYQIQAPRNIKKSLTIDQIKKNHRLSSSGKLHPTICARYLAIFLFMQWYEYQGYLEFKIQKNSRRFYPL